MSTLSLISIHQIPLAGKNDGRKANQEKKLVIIQEQPKILAGDWFNLFWLFPLSSFSNVLYINTL